MKFQIENAYLQINDRGNVFVSTAPSTSFYDTEKFLRKGDRGETLQLIEVSHS